MLTGEAGLIDAFTRASVWRFRGGAPLSWACLGVACTFWLSPGNMRGAEPVPTAVSAWHASLIEARDAAKSEGRLLLVVEISGVDDAERAKTLCPLQNTLERNPALQTQADAAWACCRIFGVRPPAAERSGSRHRGGVSEPPAELSLTWICDDAGRVLSILVGRYDAALLLAEVQWCQKLRASLPGLGAAATAAAIRNAHLARLVPSDLANFVGRQPSRWEGDTPRPLREGESFAFLSAAAAVRDVLLVDRFKLVDSDVNLLLQFRQRAELEGVCIHLALAEMPTESFDSLSAVGMRALLGARSFAVSIDSKIAWIREKTRPPAQRPLLLAVQSESQAAEVRVTGHAPERMADRLAKAIQQCHRLDVNVEDLPLLNETFAWSVSPGDMEGAAYVLLRPDGKLQSVVSQKSKIQRVVQAVEKLATTPSQQEESRQ